MREGKIFKITISSVLFPVFILLVSTLNLVPGDHAVGPEALGTAAAGGKTYYVSPRGNNSNTGTKERPWATPGYGSRQLKPGDTLIISKGRYIIQGYDRDEIWPRRSGQANNWITIKGEAGKKPILAGRNNLFTAVNLTGLSYIRIQNLEICSDGNVSGQKRYFQNGVVMEEPARYIELRDLHIHHLDDMGANISDVNHFKVINCRIEYCAISAMGGPRGKAGGWRNVLIKGCSLSYGGHYYRGGNGSNRPYDRPDGLEVPVSKGPMEIADTVAEHNRGDGLDSQVANTYIHNCIVANNSCDGIKLWRGKSRIENTLIYGTGDGDNSSTWCNLVIETDGKANHSFELVNVTIHDNPSRRAYSMTVQYDSKNISTRLLMRNCIVANSYGAAFFAPGVKLALENNIFFRPGKEPQIEIGEREVNTDQLGKLGTGNISVDPKFVKPAWGSKGDYRLKKGSPAIDSGKSTGAPAMDLSYGPRPQGRGYDRGCYEHGAVPDPSKFRKTQVSGQKTKTTVTTDTGEDIPGSNKTSAEKSTFTIKSRSDFDRISIFRNKSGKYEILLTFLARDDGFSGLFYEFDTFADASNAVQMILQASYIELIYTTSGQRNIHNLNGKKYARILLFSNK